MQISTCLHLTKVEMQFGVLQTTYVLQLCSVGNILPRLIKANTPGPARAGSLDRINHHVAQLQPHIASDYKVLLTCASFKLSTSLLSICKRPDELTSMPIIAQLVHPCNNSLPPFFRLLRFVCRNLIKKQLRCPSGRVHDQIQSALPLKQPTLILHPQPIFFQKGGKEDRAVRAVHVVKVKLDLLLRP